MAAVTICSDFGAPKNKVSHCFHCFPIFHHKVMGPDAMILVFWMLSFKPTFSLSSFTLSFKIVQFSHSYFRFRAANYRVHRCQQSGYMPAECGVRQWYWGSPIPQSHGFSVSELHRAGGERTLQNLKQVLSLKQTDHKYAKTPIISQRKIKGIIRTRWTELQMNIQHAHCISYAANLA